MHQRRACQTRRSWAQQQPARLKGYPYTAEMAKWSKSATYFQFIWTIIGEQGYYEPQVRGGWEQQGVVEGHQAVI